MEQFEEYNDFEKRARNSDGFVLQENLDYISILMANKDGSFSWVANYFHTANDYDLVLKEAIKGVTELNNRFNFRNPDWRQFKPSWLVCAEFTFIGEYTAKVYGRMPGAPQDEVVDVITANSYDELKTNVDLYLADRPYMSYGDIEFYYGLTQIDIRTGEFLGEYGEDLMNVTLGRFKSEQEAYLFLEKFHTNGIYTQSVSEIVERKNELLAQGIDVTPLQDKDIYSKIKNKDLDILLVAHKHIYSLCSYDYRPILDVAGNVVTTNINYKPHDITLTADYGIMPDDTLILAYANPNSQALRDEIDKLSKENVAYFKILRNGEILPLQADRLIQEDYAVFYGDKDNIQNGLSKLSEDDLTAINDTYPELTGYYGNLQNGGLYVTDLDGALNNKNFIRNFTSMLNRRLVKPYIDLYEQKMNWAIEEMRKTGYGEDTWDYIEQMGGGFTPEEVAGYYLGEYGELAYQTYFKNSANVQAEPYTEDPFRQRVLDILFNAIGKI